MNAGRYYTDSILGSDVNAVSEATANRDFHKLNVRSGMTRGWEAYYHDKDRRANTYPGIDYSWAEAREWLSLCTALSIADEDILGPLATAVQGTRRLNEGDPLSAKPRTTRERTLGPSAVTRAYPTWPT